MTNAITIAILAMGGEGGGVLADWIVDLAESNGYRAQTTSVPGVAQRTGSTIYYIELFPDDAGREPVLALMPVPGELDVVLGSELMEAARAVQRGLVTPDRTTLIASTHRVYSMTEKTAMGDGRAGAAQFIGVCQAAAKNFVHADFAHIAEETNSVISAALFGALAATGALPFDRARFEAAIQSGGVGVQSSLAAFAQGYAASNAPIEAGATPSQPPEPGRLLEPLAQRIARDSPPAAHAILLAGIERLADYQDVAYAAEYLDRLDPIRAVDRAPFTLLRETARHLALWMSYEDAIRVADLKVRRARFERVHQEARVQPNQILEINEFLHPRVGEIADILPRALGQWMLNTAWVARLVNKLMGKGMTLRTTSIIGFLQLYFLSALRPLRRKSFRFDREQKKIAQWLVQIPELARENDALAIEVAECPRLIKGYGDTHVLGNRNFDALMNALPALRTRPDAALRLKQLREAALADDTGEKLSQALHEVTA